jgi:predicted peptidase
MNTLTAALALAAALVQPQPTSSGIYRMVFSAPDVGPVPYGLSIPRGYNPRQPRPLVLALHPGGERFEYYGSAFMQQIVAPALADLGAIIVAPDCPTRAWTDPAAERAVMALIASVISDYAIDRSRVLVTGFSLGGRGTWFMALHHSDFFTAAIPMAGAPGDEPLDPVAKIPMYVIHSRQDEVVPFAPAERAVEQLKKLGAPIEFEALNGIRHFEMGRYVPSLERAGRWVAGRWRK